MKRYNSILFILFCSMFFSGVVRASNCDSAQTQNAINQCLQDDYTKADQKLNEVYKKVMAKTDAAKKQKLVAVQKTWITFRDAHCNYVASAWEGGSMQPAMISACLTELTNQRVDQLNTILQDSNN